MSDEAAEDVLVHTTRGLVPRSQLTVDVAVHEDANNRYTVTNWFLGGEKVRNDVQVSSFRGFEIGSSFGAHDNGQQPSDLHQLQE